MKFIEIHDDCLGTYHQTRLRKYEPTKISAFYKRFAFEDLLAEVLAARFK